MRADPCEERHALSLKIYGSGRSDLRSKSAIEAAKERKAANVSTLRQLLIEARATEGKLATALREHIETHSCVH